MAILVASLIQGLTAFGFGLVAIPILLWAFSPHTVVPFMRLLGLFQLVFLLVQLREHVRIRRIWPLVLTGIPAGQLGTYLLIALDANTLKALMGLVTVLSAIAYLRGFSVRIENEKRAFAVTGLLGGLLSGSTGMGGAPVVIPMSNQRVEKEAFRANLTAYFVMQNLFCLLTSWIGGLITRQVLRYAFCFLPSCVLGLLIGNRMARVVIQEAFRKVTLVLLLVTGAVAVLTGLGLTLGAAPAWVSALL